MARAEVQKQSSFRCLLVQQQKGLQQGQMLLNCQTVHRRYTAACYLCLFLAALQSMVSGDLSVPCYHHHACQVIYISAHLKVRLKASSLGNPGPYALALLLRRVKGQAVREDKPLMVLLQPGHHQQHLHGAAVMQLVSVLHHKPS